jgi:hypothetical protein
VATGRSRFPLRLALSVVLAGAILVLARSLTSEIHGNFYFRQAHVAANIELYLAHGLSLRPETYNLDIPYSLFDFPAYQLLVAAVSRSAGSPPLVTARVVSILTFLLAALVIERILAACGVSSLHRILTVLFFSFQPLNLFYFQCPMADCLAVASSLVSLYGYVLWDAKPPPRKGLGLVLLLAGGVLATLIKNPVYLPFFVAILVHAAVRHRASLARRWEILVFVIAIGTAVVGFKLLSNRVNAIQGFFDTTETSDYFGPLADRTDPRSWRRIARVLVHETETPMAFLLTVVGAGLYVWRSRSRYKALFLGLLGGVVATILVFFNRFTWHDYYQLPFVFPLAFFAAYSLVELRARARARLGSGPAARRAIAGALLLAGAAAIALSISSLGLLETLSTDEIRASGEWIRDRTAPGDFVIYLVESEDLRDWNPVFLYFAKRFGFNLTTRRLEHHRDTLDRLERRFADENSLLVFCPRAAEPRLAALIEAAGGELFEAGRPGRLYRLGEPSRDGTEAAGVK